MGLVGRRIAARRARQLLAAQHRQLPQVRSQRPEPMPIGAELHEVALRTRLRAPSRGRRVGDADAGSEQVALDRRSRRCRPGADRTLARRPAARPVLCEGGAHSRPQFALSQKAGRVGEVSERLERVEDASGSHPDRRRPSGTFAVEGQRHDRRIARQGRGDKKLTRSFCSVKSIIGQSRKTSAMSLSGIWSYCLPERSANWVAVPGCRSCSRRRGPLPA